MFHLLSLHSAQGRAHIRLPVTRITRAKRRHKERQGRLCVHILVDRGREKI